LTRLDTLDLGLFDFDRHNAIYFFILNAEERIYLRYGGRDSDSPTTYLDLESLTLALAQGLEQHRLYEDGRLPPPQLPRPAPLFAREIAGLASEMARGRCVECHLVADYGAQEREAAGRLDKLQEMYRSPDIHTLGIELDIPQGLVVATISGAAAAAGVLAGDRIVALEETPVFTFADLQYRLDRVPRTTERLGLDVERGGRRHRVTLALPHEWWLTDLLFRVWTIEPLLYFSSDRLSDDEKSALGLPIDGFACRVRFVEAKAKALSLHELAPGDVLYAVDGVTGSPHTTSCEVHLKLSHRAGDTVTLSLIREGQRIELPLTSRRQYFRKPERTISGR
jgi:hypothetical protein